MIVPLDMCRRAGLEVKTVSVNDELSVTGSHGITIKADLRVTDSEYKPEKAEMNLSSAQFYDKRHPRSVVGTDNDGWVYFVVIDGRSAGNADGTTIYETAWICRMLGMEDAINMDGGGSSCLWSDQEGVLNHPSDNKKFDHEGERIVPSIIAVF